VALLSGSVLGFGAGLGAKLVHPKMIRMLVMAFTSLAISITLGSGSLIVSNSATTRLGTIMLHVSVVFHASEAVALWDVKITLGNSIFKNSGFSGIGFTLGFLSCDALGFFQGSETFSFLPGIGFTLGFLSCNALGFFDEGSETFSFLPGIGLTLGFLLSCDAVGFFQGSETFSFLLGISFTLGFFLSCDALGFF